MKSSEEKPGSGPMDLTLVLAEGIVLGVFFAFAVLVMTPIALVRIVARAFRGGL